MASKKKQSWIGFHNHNGGWPYIGQSREVKPYATITAAFDD